MLAASEGALFDGARKEYERLASRADELIVRHVVREVLAEMKAYLARYALSVPPLLFELMFETGLQTMGLYH